LKFIKHLFKHILFNVRLFNTPSYAHHYWIWCVDKNGGRWSNSRNHTTGCPTDLGGGYDIILEFIVESNTTS